MKIKDKAIDKVIKRNKELFSLLKEARGERKAIDLVVQIDTERESRLAACEYITVQRSIPLDMFNTFAGDYDTMAPKVRDKVLYILGYDTKTCATSVFTRVERGAGNTIKVYKEILGQERLDKQWINARDHNGNFKSSYEAREYLKNRKDPTRVHHMSFLQGGVHVD